MLKKADILCVFEVFLKLSKSIQNVFLNPELYTYYLGDKPILGLFFKKWTNGCHLGFVSKT